MKLSQMESDHHDQLAAVGASQEEEVETAKGDLEEAHRKEVIDLQNRLEAQKQKGGGFLGISKRTELAYFSVFPNFPERL